MFDVTRTVQRLPYLGEGDDGHGNPVDSWGEPEDVDIFDFDPGATDEPRMPGSDRVTISPTIYGPYGMPFQPKDKVIVDGEPFQVQGQTRRWAHGDDEAGAVVTLWRADG